MHYQSFLMCLSEVTTYNVCHVYGIKFHGTVNLIVRITTPVSFYLAIYMVK